MRHLRFFSLTLALCAGAVLHGASQTLTVLQWNTFHGGRGTDDRVDPSRQVNWMAAKNPDVITLNEVTAPQADDYRQRLETATGETWYAYHVVSQTDGIGNEILSRHQLLTTSSYRMKTNGEYRRGVTEATIDAGGTFVNVFATHLDNANSAVRAAQVQELLAFMQGFSGPAILAGDLNAAPESAELQPLFADVADTWMDALATGRAVAYPDNPPGPDTRTRGSRIDYVLHTSGLTTVQAEIPDQRDWSQTGVVEQVGTTDDLAVRPSDHNFVFAVLSVSDR
ncbi:MAG TPA: endonuclease/exonuclease/phosphatase family protein [Vicinamibacterales bacterium]|nr:endonuclease/exonuclease/phosphatase family protein [Vicinamibacterales bacterium]